MNEKVKTTRIWDDILSDHDRQVISGGPFGMNRRLGSNPCLLIIDMQYGVIGDDVAIPEQQNKSPLACGNFAWAAIRQLQRLIPAARNAGVPVIYTRNVFGKWGETTPIPEFREENPLSEIVKEIAPVEGDIVVKKTKASGFFNTMLINHLIAGKINTILVTGNTTSGCVRATAIDGVSYNFRVACVEECIFDRIEISHKASLLDLWMKYTNVTPVNEALNYLEDIAKQRKDEGKKAGPKK